MDKRKIVSRHNPKVTNIDEYSPLTVGNGEIAFTADITGLQTFSECYTSGIPLCTQSQWGWHTTPASNVKGKYTLCDLRYKDYDIRGKKVPYPTDGVGQEEVFNWLRQNPHRLHLGRIGLLIRDDKGQKINATDILYSYQEIDLWTGVMFSSFEVLGERVVTKTFCHPSKDLLVFKIKSNLLESKSLGVEISFPYGSPEKNAADWQSEEKHKSEVIINDEMRFLIRRTLDNDIYYADIALKTDAQVEKKSDHDYIIKSINSDELIFMVGFKKEQSNEMISYNTAKKECEKYWASYWQNGGMIDFSKCKDKRAFELERRVVLSQYLMDIQCAGSLPSQETGLTFNSWYGKYHLEMHWWHGVHFMLWNRSELFEKSLWWYDSIMNKAKATAKMQGYTGARWPKMTDISGNESPSPIGPLLVWQQPHPIYYAETLFSINKNQAILEKYKNIVLETAEFMASYVRFDKETARYILGPCLIPAQENHDPMETINPTFELEYWHFGLSVANKWRERLGMSRNKKWDEICANISELPQKDGAYLAHENCKDTFSRFNFDHPSMLGALGILKGEKVDKSIMKNTINRVFDEWDVNQVWGWDFPMMAMTCARLGMQNKAIDSLLYNAPKNEYLVNGHNKQGDKVDLPIYLPGNGGLLAAVAMMVAGWDGCDEKCPGFPKDGNWDIEWEDLNKML